MSNIAKVMTADIANGLGFRVSVFLTGCPIQCKGCFNSSIWDPSSGKPLDSIWKGKIIKELKKEWIKRIEHPWPVNPLLHGI